MGGGMVSPEPPSSMNEIYKLVEKAREHEEVH